MFWCKNIKVRPQTLQNFRHELSYVCDVPASFAKKQDVSKSENVTFPISLPLRSLPFEGKHTCSLSAFEALCRVVGYIIINLGNDIARRSFKRPKPSSKMSKTEANMNRQSTLLEESEAATPSHKGSQGSLNKLEKELSNVSTSTLKALEDEKDKEETVSAKKSARMVCKGVHTLSRRIAVVFSFFPTL